MTIVSYHFQHPDTGTEMAVTYSSQSDYVFVSTALDAYPADQDNVDRIKVDCSGMEPSQIERYLNRIGADWFRFDH